jgi:hypothetical protein
MILYVKYEKKSPFISKISYAKIFGCIQKKKYWEIPRIVLHSELLMLESRLVYNGHFWKMLSQKYLGQISILGTNKCKISIFVIAVLKVDMRSVPSSFLIFYLLVPKIEMFFEYILGQNSLEMVIVGMVYGRIRCSGLVCRRLLVESMAYSLA